MPTSSMVPSAACSGGTYAIAMATPSVGDMVPLVTTPHGSTSAPGRYTG